jgi:hypothetical protein
MNRTSSLWGQTAEKVGMARTGIFTAGSEMQGLGDRDSGLGVRNGCGTLEIDT